MKLRLPYILIAVLFSFAIALPIMLPYFHSGYFPTHDGEWAVIRLVDMFRIIKDGQFPARMSGALNFGYGYPLFNFAYPFPYYAGLPLYFILGSFVASIKVLFAGSVVLSAFFFFLASNALWKNRWAASISTVLYIYLPYRIVDLYVRGSIGESLSFAIFSFIFYLSLKLFDSPFSRVVITFLAFSIGALVMTHNIMSVYFLPTLVAFVVVRILIERRWDTLQTFLLSLVLGIGLASFFWLPALFEKNNILLSVVPIADRASNFVTLDQIVIPSWGYGTPGVKDGFSYQLGIPQLLVILISLVLVALSFFKRKTIQTPVYKYATIFLFIFLTAFILMFSFTLPIWKVVPLLKEINYPWTLLAPLGFVSSMLVGFLVIENRTLKYLAVALAILSIILVFPHAKPKEYVERNADFYLTNEATTTSSHELMPLWVKKIPDTHVSNKVDVISGDAKVSNITYNSKKISFTYSATQDSVVAINTIFYPGWRGYTDLDQTDITHNNDKGVMEMRLPAHKTRVLLVLDETLLRYLADSISILAAVVIGFLLLRPLLQFK